MDLMLQRLRETSLRTSLPASTTTDRTDDSGHSDMSEIQDAVRAHNKARIPRECPIMQWDAELSAMAAEYARALAVLDELKHSGVKDQGENLYVSTAESTYVDAVDVWLAEMTKYGGEKIVEGKLGAYGHFTQCIWHNTTHLGMGKAKSKSGNTYIVARYTPPGNIVGQKPYGCR